MAYAARPVRALDEAHANAVDRAMMRAALDEARASAARSEAPIGCVIYETRTGRVLSHAGNVRETLHDATGHAEVVAIREAGRALGSWRLHECTLVVTLEPCAMCAGAIVQARVGRVVFGTSDPKAGFVGSLGNLLKDARLNHRVDAIGGVEALASAAMLREFFEARRAQKRRAR
jgi:tRNA(adenine34) deaminase